MPDQVSTGILESDIFVCLNPPSCIVRVMSVLEEWVGKPSLTRKLELLALVCYNKSLWRRRWLRDRWWVGACVFPTSLKSGFFTRPSPPSCIVRAKGVLEGWSSNPRSTKKLEILALVYYNKKIRRRWPWCLFKWLHGYSKGVLLLNRVHYSWLYVSPSFPTYREWCSIFLCAPKPSLMYCTSLNQFPFN